MKEKVLLGRKTEDGRRTAAAPRNLCSMRYYLFWMKVQRTETLNGNVECRISLPALLTGNNPVRRSDGESGRKKTVHVRLIPEGLHVYSNGKRMPHATPAGVVQKSASWYFYKHLMPLASRTREKTKRKSRYIGEIWN